MASEDERWPLKDAADGEAGEYVPPSLLPGVLDRLGLGRERRPQASIAELVVELGNAAWYVRARAVRTLGDLGTQIPGAILIAALDDAHLSVRAAAVHALVKLGEHAPLPRLAQALQDSEWQVREAAAHALGRLGRQASTVPLLGALHDPDCAVHEAARSALESTHPELLSSNIALTSSERDQAQ